VPTELGAVSFGGAAAQAVATVTRRKLAKRKVFNIERENMRSPFGSPAFGSKKPNDLAPLHGL